MQVGYEHGVFRNTLRAKGLKYTKVRCGVFEVLVKYEKPMTPQEIRKRVPGIAESSVYRALESLMKAGIVHMVPRGFKSLYELSDAFLGHHHHVVCERCGKVVAIENDKIEVLISDITKGAGMKPTRHFVELYGVCCRCED